MSVESEAGYPTDEQIGGLRDPEIAVLRTTESDHSETQSLYPEGPFSDDDLLTQDSRSSQKRQADNEAIKPILKRHKGLFNNTYLELLNRDIEDAANHRAVGGDDELPASQVGMTVWTPFEKKVFFDAVSRLGRDNLGGVADRIRTKSEVEVHQYIALLQDAVERREQEQERRLEPLELKEYPAAVEISQPCCHALEEAADALSFRQERHEELAEQKRWGHCWNVTQEIAKRIEGDHGLEKDPKFINEHGVAFMEVLRVKNWLRLSERIFMNAPHAENNWQFVSEEPPSIRTTALQDFHSLLVAVTKKTVLATLFMAESRIRGKRSVVPATRGLVKRKDVEAAVASLGMKQNSNEFWATCPRRLRLEIWNDDPDSQNEFADADDDDDDDEGQAMSYDQVEKSLRQGSPGPEPTSTKERFPTPQISEDAYSSDLSDADSDPEASLSESSEVVGDAENEVVEEAREILKYSAYDFPKTQRAKEALKNRIRNERAQEVHAEQQDAEANYEAEMEMWRLLQREPPEPLAKPDPVDCGRRGLKDVEDIFDVGRQWRERLTYHSEWEMLEPPEPLGRRL